MLNPLAKRFLPKVFAAVSLLVVLALPTPVHASNEGGVVGNGTAVSCTEAAFAAVVAGGGAVSFNCGPAPVTITITTGLTISKSTAIDGGGLVTLSGGGASVQLFLVNISSVTLSLSNLVIRDFGRPAAYVTSGLVNIHNTTFIGHQRTALSNVGNAARMNIAASTFLSNTSNGSGGAIYNTGVLTVSRSLFQSNFTANSFNGGALYNATSGAVASIDRSTFRDNMAGYGGAIDNSAVMTMTNSAILNNTALNAGGSGGGGLFQGSFGNLSLVNVTFSGNTIPAADRGAAIFIGGTALSQARLQNVTIANNVPATPANGSVALVNSSSIMTVTNTINRDGACSLTSSSMTLPQLVDGGGNLAFNNATGCPGINADPQLTPLQDNGGPTLTFAISSGTSAAVNGGINAGCPQTDQRGVIRPRNGACDIGAVERDAMPLFNALSPDKVCAGVSSLLVTATGVNFIDGLSGTRIRLNGSPLPTTFVSPTQLQAAVGPSALLAPPHTISFTLETPVIDGGVATAERYILVEDCVNVAISGLTAVSDGPTNLGGVTQFTATVATGNKITYVWDFGDGQTGSGANPTHIYGSVGSYIATVTATNAVNHAVASTVVNINLSTTGLLISRLDSEFGAVITYTYVVTHVSPPGSPSASVTITGNVPSNTVLISHTGAAFVPTGGDYGNGYVSSAPAVVLQPGQSTRLIWVVRSTVVIGDVINQAHASTHDGRLQVFARDRVNRVFIMLVAKT